MKSGRKLMVVVAVVVALSTGLASVAFAQTPVEGNVTVAGGTLSVTPQEVSLLNLNLGLGDATSGVAQSAASNTDLWIANDPTGSGDGWHVTVEASDFANETHVIPLNTEEIPDAFQVDVASISKNTTTSSDTLPASGGAQILSPASAVTVLNAESGTGMGSYSFNPGFTLKVPADTYAGDYTSSITVTIAPNVVP